MSHERQIIWQTVRPAILGVLVALMAMPLCSVAYAQAGKTPKKAAWQMPPFPNPGWCTNIFRNVRNYGVGNSEDLNECIEFMGIQKHCASQDASAYLEYYDSSRGRGQYIYCKPNWHPITIGEQFERIVVGIGQGILTAAPFVATAVSGVACLTGQIYACAVVALEITELAGVPLAGVAGEVVDIVADVPQCASGNVASCASMGLRGAAVAGLTVPGVDPKEIAEDVRLCDSGMFAACMRLGKTASDAGGLPVGLGGDNLASADDCLAGDNEACILLGKKAAKEGLPMGGVPLGPQSLQACKSGSVGGCQRLGHTLAQVSTPSWKQWFRITDGGGLKSPVTALTPRPGHVDLFVTGNDGFVYSTYHEAAGGWQKWFRLGDLQVPSRSPITAVATRPGHIDLFVVGKDGGVYSTFHEAEGGWRPWFRIGYVGVAAGSNVAALHSRDGHMDLFVVGSDSRIYSTYHEAQGGWRDWFPIGDRHSPPGSEITALLSRPGHIDLFVSGTEGWVYSTYHEAVGGWRGWFKIGFEDSIKMQPGSPITAVSTGVNEIYLFAVGADGAVYYTSTLETGWFGWSKVTGVRAVPGTRVAALATRPHHRDRAGHLDLFAVDVEGRVFSTYFFREYDNPIVWEPWFPMTGMTSTPGAAVTVLATRPDHIDLFVSGTDSGVYSNWHDDQPTVAPQLVEPSRQPEQDPAEKKRSIPFPEQGFAADKRSIQVPGVELTTAALRTPSEPPICASARSARARNSPTAQLLELQCQADGGKL